MTERNINPGDIVRHFKRETLTEDERRSNKYLYKIIGVAEHTETKEKLMIYMALYDDFGIYARPLEMFLSEVDREKYPDIKQRYRFEQVFFDDVSGYVSVDEKGNEDSLDNEPVILPVFDEETEAVDDRLMKFLDAEGYAQKLEVLSELRDNLDDKLIDAMAVSMDVEVLPGTIDERYASLRHCIQAHAKYECTRLR